jgi:hypothetical protein
MARQASRLNSIGVRGCPPLNDTRIDIRCQRARCQRAVPAGAQDTGNLQVTSVVSGMMLERPDLGDSFGASTNVSRGREKFDSSQCSTDFLRFTN